MFEISFFCFSGMDGKINYILCYFFYIEFILYIYRNLTLNFGILIENNILECMEKKVIYFI